MEFKLDGDFTQYLLYRFHDRNHGHQRGEVLHHHRRSERANTRSSFAVDSLKLVGVNQIIDKSDLDALYQANKDKTQGDYTDASWADFAARDAAKAALDNPNATQKDVDDAFDGLTEAIVGLETETPVVVDKSELEALYNANKDKTQGNYTDASWADFVAARDAAKDVIDDSTATGPTSPKAIKALEDAITGLREETGSSSESGRIERTRRARRVEQTRRVQRRGQQSPAPVRTIRRSS